MVQERHLELLEEYPAISEDGGVDGYTPSFVDVDGIKTRYYDVGEGEPLVLLHGGSWYGSASGNTWARNFAGLSEHFRVIAPDRLGNGMTNCPDDPADFTYDVELAHMSDLLLETLGLEEFHLAGQSRGGGMTGRLAVRYPDRVKSAVVVNSGTLAPEAGDYDRRRNRIYRRAPTDETTPEYHRFFYEQYSDTTDHITDEYVQTCAYMAARPKAQRVDEIFGRTGQQNMWKDQNEWFSSLEAHIDETHRRIRAGEMNMPTLLWWGINDPTIALRAGIALYDMMAQTNPSVRMQLVNHAGHYGYRAYPDEFNQAVNSFIDFWC